VAWTPNRPYSARPEATSLIDVKDTDWAYAAGFVDGEGCIAVGRSFNATRMRFYYNVQVVVANRDRAVLDWLLSLWGGWVGPISRPRGLARPAWHWRGPTGASARPFLTGIRPYLKLKARQCDNAMAMIELSQRSRRTLGRAPLPAAWLAEQEELYWIQRELNHRGTDPFVRKPMHSPRKIHRQRLAESMSF
jgi:hypothetical protein